MINVARRCASAGAFAAVTLWSMGALAQAQSTLLPPQCAGKTGAQLDQCVRDLTAPTASEHFEFIQPKTDPKALLNCNMLNRADQGFCIARNEIIIECRKPAKYASFDACVSGLITRPQRPHVADCSRAAAGQRDACGLRNKYMAECLKDPWQYFICLGEKMYTR